MDPLPPDVIYRIADRLSFKWLVRFRCSCKEWYTNPFLIKTCKTKFEEEPKIVALDGDSRWRDPDRKPLFDVAEEDFSLLPSCPISIDTLFDLGNHPGVAAFNKPRGYFNIWELNFHNEGWTKKYKIVSPLLQVEGTSVLGGYYFDIVGTQDETIFFKIGKTLYSYDPRSRKLECVHVEWPATEFYCLRGKVESLSQFNV